MKIPRTTALACLLAAAVLCFHVPVSGDYIKPPTSLEDPPDVDKTAADATCWLATAANMLAAAGYGTSGGSTVQQRADYIYGQLKAWNADDNK